MQARVDVSRPVVIAAYSRDGAGALRIPAAEPRVYRPARLGIDLTEGFDKFVDKKDGIDDLKAPLAAINSAKFSLKDNRIAFVSFRNNLNKIMGTAYNRRDPWRIGVTRFCNVVYLDVRPSVDPALPVCDQPDNSQGSRLFSFMGYSFEAKSTVSADGSPNDRPIDPNNEYCTVSRLRIGRHRILLAAEIDCVSRPAAGHPIELKTAACIRNEKQRFVFRRYKMLSSWIQSFLVNTPVIVFGFRDEQNRLAGVERFATEDIPRQCQDLWSAHECLSLTDNVLSFLQDHVEESRAYLLQFSAPFHEIRLTQEPMDARLRISELWPEVPHTLPET
ncbi:Decapping nuclease [Plasmodiophora brassicae]